MLTAIPGSAETPRPAREALSRAGYEVLEAASGEAAGLEVIHVSSYTGGVLGRGQARANHGGYSLAWGLSREGHLRAV